MATHMPLFICQLGYLHFPSNVGVIVLGRDMEISKWEKGVL